MPRRRSTRPQPPVLSRSFNAPRHQPTCVYGRSLPLLSCAPATRFWSLSRASAACEVAGFPGAVPSRVAVTVSDTGARSARFSQTPGSPVSRKVLRRQIARGLQDAGRAAGLPPHRPTARPGARSRAPESPAAAAVLPQAASGRGRGPASGAFRTGAEPPAEGRSGEGGAYLASGPVWLHLHPSLRASPSIRGGGRSWQPGARPSQEASARHPSLSPELALYSGGLGAGRAPPDLPDP
ncbi:translation initiation factor IF-2-like [Lutra lutra]|uniref:translation initiation factor IF-2-like n=1 Tax=Lutra lutra TaxID=9657 RepID=UPI001FD31454|nr:translation initiation factor IF-2-like [Lutra lutra]